MAPLDRSRSRQGGAALILVLSVVALLSVMVIAYLGSSTRQMNLSQNLVVNLRGAEVASLASGQVVQDLLQEIRAGSVEVTPPVASAPPASTPILYPATALGAAPDRSSASSPAGVPPPPNLLKQSASGRKSYDSALKFGSTPVFPQADLYPVVARASSLASSSGPGAVSQVRWNRPLLLPRAKPLDPLDFTPAATGKAWFGGSDAPYVWKAPDWVYLQRNGANPLKYDSALSVNGSNPAVARYAFQMYDIGGLLDLNVAGYDPDTSVVGADAAARRGSIGLADLTQVGLTADQLKKLLAQRNPATLEEKDNPTGQLSFGNRYVNFLMDGQKNLGFIRVAGGTGSSGASNRAFSSRQGLLSYLQQLGTTDAEKAKLVEALQSLTHFSRSLEQPSYKPGFFNPKAADSTPKTPVFSRPTIVAPKARVDDILHPITVVADADLGPGDVRKNAALGGPLPYEMALGNNRGGNDAWGRLEERLTRSSDTRPLQDVINPGFLEVRVKTAFLRQDGTRALAGEPLVKKRFPLERLAWLTYKGPSALLTASDELFNPGGTALAIYDAFGLTWTKDRVGGYWFWAYDHGKPGNIYKLEELLATAATPAGAPKGARGTPREPDFFELLKATIGVGSLGKPASAQHSAGKPWDVGAYYQARDRNSNFQLLEIAANIIDQYDADSFPTLVRLPNPGVASASAYSPPLFSAKGTEDLPYFYRFHWRGIEDAKDKPNKPLPNNAPVEITGNIGSYSGASFKCGTTFLMGFPELWNPHALNGTGVPAKLAPTQFRVVAASEAPQDLVDPLFAKLPKLGNLPKGNPLTSTDPARLWMQFVNYNWTDFCIKPAGYFAYKLYNTSTGSQPATQTWLYEWNQFYFSTQDTFNGLNGNLMGLNGNTWAWSWPLDNLQTTAVAIGTYGADNRSKGLFWCDPAKFIEPPGLLKKDARVTNFFLAIAPIWKIPNGVSSDADFLTKCMLPRPQGWPEQTWQFKGKIKTGPLPVKTIYDPPTSPVPTRFDPEPDPTALYQVDADNNFTFDVSLYAFVPMRWPLTPDPFKLHFTASYTVGDGIRGPGPLTLQSGKPFQQLNSPKASTVPTYSAGPEPTFPPYRGYAVALTDRPGVQRALVESYPGPTYTNPPMGINANGTMDGGNQGNNRVVDMRGTELTFSLGNPHVFREPSVLCQPGRPTGSSLAAGPDNFFAKAPYGGAVQGMDGADWVGFSMGEIPSQYIAVTKMFKRDKPSDVDRFGNLVWTIDGNDPAMDVYQNKRGKELIDSSNDYMVTGPNAPPEHYKLRFFQIPTNVAGIRNSTRFTVRVQYKDPVSSQWITYDERFMEMDAGDWGRWTSMPILGKPEITPVSHPPQDPTSGTIAWKDLRRPIGWNAPLITSYDPRTPRFAHPMRYGYNYPDSIRGTAANRLQTLNPSPSDLTGFFPESSSLLGKYNRTDRPDSAFVDLPTGSKAQTTTPRFMAPASWANWIYWSCDNEPYKSVYDYVTGNKPAKYIPGKTPSPQTLVYGPAWWAKAKDPRTAQIIYQYPTGNAYDYGWMPRLADTAPAGSLARNSVPQNKKDVTPDKTLPNFWQDAPGGNYADALRIGDFSENIAPSPASSGDPNAPYRQAYADPDDVVRRASGALAPLGGYSPSVPIEGLPQGQSKTAAASNRPVMLNRPFRAVAEMGAAFRGAPWKHVDFFLPESADAALLDVFCLTEPPPMPVKGSNSALPALPPLVAGKVSLNTRQIPVLKAMLAGALKDETTTTGRLSAAMNAEADMAARALITRTTGNKDWQGPLTNNAELVGKLFAKDLLPAPAKTDPVYTSTVYKTNTEPDRNPDIDVAGGKTTLNWHFTGLSSDLDKVFSVTKDRKTKRFRESVIRALADGGQTRVWNLMLDIVVQPGKFNTLATKLEDFIREGETRLWVFLSVDRLTGEILDQQLEWVTD